MNAEMTCLSLSAILQQKTQMTVQEKVAIDGFIDRKIVGFDDLVRLNANYGVLLDKKYSPL